MMKHFFSVLFFSFFLFKSQAQIDTSFWFVAPQVPAVVGVNSVSLELSSYSQAATILVRQPANLSGVNMTITLAANSSTLVDMSPFQALITSTLANGPDIKGLYISSNNLISSNYIIASNSGQESISLKGSSAAGDDFYTPFPNNLFSLSTGSLMNTSFDVVATETGTTTLLITPRAGMVGRTKDIPFVTTLLQGETFPSREILRNRSAVSVVSRDLDGDLDADLAVVDGLNNMLLIFTNNGAGL